MDKVNYQMVVDRDYMVSWKADGTRYLLLIEHGKCYMIGRDNCVFKVPNMWFPNKNKIDKPVTNTLMDGELVYAPLCSAITH